MENQKIADAINRDIELGIYDDFAKLKNRLEFIAHKLILTLYVENAKELSNGEIRTLKENDYL